jgi:uracil-DNA glycosylase
MCVAERPSTGTFPDPSVRRLYNLLDKLGIPDSHLTDVIKSRGKVGEPYPSDMRPHKEVFDEEIDIVKPRCIVAFGQKVFDLLQFALAGSGIKIYQVHHYAYARRGARAAAAFEKTFRKAIKAYRQQMAEG